MSNLHRIKIFSKNKQNNNNALTHGINEDMKKLKTTLDSVSSLDLQGLKILQGLNIQMTAITNKNREIQNLLNTKSEEIKNEVNSQLDTFENEKVKPVDTKINTLTDNFDALNSNTEAVINALTDEGKINLAQLKTKILSVKPAEQRTMRNNINTVTSNYDAMKVRLDRIVPIADKASLDVLNFNTNLQNTQNILTSMQKITKLQLNDTYFNDEIYFINCGEWGWLDGLITLKETLPRQNVSVCPIDFNYTFDGNCVVFNAINAFKIVNKNIYITKPDLSTTYPPHEIKFYSFVYKRY